MVDKKIIARNFSRCAHLYDKYAAIQCLAAAELLKELPRRQFRNILEIGCGTGIYTGLLRDSFNGARIKAIDISKVMVETARRKQKNGGIEFVVGDGEDARFGGGFDLITSNAAFQWFNDLRRAAGNFKNGLKPKGIVAFTIFGPATFKELAGVLRELAAGSSIAAESFPTRLELEGILNANFNSISIRELIVKEAYASFTELLARIKYTGAAGNGANGFAWKRRLIARADDLYRKMFGAVEATYQIFLCRASI